ncbi:uncharacterized mitochondrial protein-like protein [Tanacetum coccineum]|uniref:Uncharacterized mitochondrial protein-like protein n=1 Tax=Tanacetum coccineum TaxID=301880 RepID=A0ABQ5CY73_9ASTR
MLSASKLPLFFWAEAIATACYTQNRSIIIPTLEKMAYHIINDRKPSIKHLHIFGCICYLTRDGENLDKMKEKGDPCILVGYSTQSKGYRVYNKRTRLIVESIHLKFDEIKEMSETSVANDTSGLVPQRQKASDYDKSDPVPQLQNVSPSADTTAPSQQELELLFGPLYDEFFNSGTSRVNKSSSPTDNSALQDTHPSTNIQPTSEPTTPTNAHAEENNDNQADDTEHKFTNPFCTPVQEVAESSSRNIEAMQEELHQFDRLQVWELIDKPFGKNVIKLKWLWKNKKDEDQTPLGGVQDFCRIAAHMSFPICLPSEGTFYGIVNNSESLTRHSAKLYVIVQDIKQDTKKHLKEVKRIFRYLRGTIHMGLWYPKGSGFELTAFSYADQSRCLELAKSTSGGIQFLGDKLVSWMSKKQNCTAMSSAEAEYVALSASCAQVMWMQTQLQDYGFNYNKIPLYCDSQSAIAISCNPMQHSLT